MTFTQRTPGGLPRTASYSNGIAVLWEYDAQWNTRLLEYSKGGAVLDSFAASYDRYGHRRESARPAGDCAGGQGGMKTAFERR